MGQNGVGGGWVKSILGFLAAPTHTLCGKGSRNNNNNNKVKEENFVTLKCEASSRKEWRGETGGSGCGGRGRDALDINVSNAKAPQAATATAAADAAAHVCVRCVCECVCVCCLRPQLLCSSRSHARTAWPQQQLQWRQFNACLATATATPTAAAAAGNALPQM